MKKILGILLGLSLFTSVYATDMNNTTDMNDVTNNHIYFDYNLGLMAPIGNGSGYNQGGTIDFGYMFNNNFGLEGGILGAGSFGNASTQVVNYSAFDVAAKGVLPLSNYFALYGKLGLALGQFDSNTYYANGSGGVSINQQYDNSFGALIGAGVQFNLSSAWSLHVEDDYVAQFNAPSGYLNPNLMMIGGEFRF